MLCNSIYIRIVPESMASKQAGFEGEDPSNLDENLSYSSHEGEEYDAASYGSELQPPGLTHGFTMVHENCCRARYRPSTAPKSAPYNICLNKSTCRSLYGGTDHSILRGGQRAESGVYEGVYSKGGKLLCAKAGTRTTVRAMELQANASRASDRAHAASLNVCPSDPPPFSISAAEDQLTSEGDGEQILETSGANLTAKDTMFLNLLSSLCQKVDSLGKKSEAGQDGHGNQHDAQSRTNPSILRRSKEKGTKDNEAISSVAQRHDQATRTRTKAKSKAKAKHTGYEDTSLDEGEEESLNEFGSDEDTSIVEVGDEGDRGWSDYDEDGFIDCRPVRKKGSRHRHLFDYDDRRISKTNQRNRTSSRCRLYAIACGRGGVQTTGLYREEWDVVKCLVSGFSKAKFKKVKNESEGMQFIRRHFKHRNKRQPRWLERGQCHYPSISQIRCFLGLENVSEDESEGYNSETSDSDEGPRPKPKGKGRRSAVIGLDPSVGKDSELFGVDLKNVNTLEKGLAPAKLGKHTVTLFLEQIDDVTAYPRHANHRNNDGLGDFVEAVADINQQHAGRKDGARDTGWKGKSRNALGAIKTSDELGAALSYLLEEQHTILETCHGDFESILLNAQVDEDTATDIVTNSLGMRIVRDTLHSYVSLLTHLAGISNTRGWSVCASQLNHHAEKLGLLRGKYRHRIQLMGKIYIYLRDGQSKNWMSLKLQHAEITSLRAQVQGSGETGGIVHGYGCSHCKSGLHGGGRTACPWKDKPSNEAKKAASNFMLRMSDGSVAAATPN